MKKLKGILFDLDGTLVDTAHDVISAVNHVFLKEKIEPPAFEELKIFVSDGAKALLTYGLGEKYKEEHIENFRDFYIKNITSKSCLFEGAGKVLDFIQNNGMKWGVVTNKPYKLSLKILQNFKLSPNCLIGGDSLSSKKPSPLPLLYAAHLLEIEPNYCCYVGDHKNDILAAKSAGMISIAAKFGYINPSDDIKIWEADIYIEKMSDLIFLLK